MKNIYSPSYYQILELTPEATPDQIKASYRRLMKLHHEDKNPGNVSAREMSQLINEANEILSTPEKRVKYDIDFHAHLKLEEEKKQARFQEAFRKQRETKQATKQRAQPSFDFGSLAMFLLIIIGLLAVSSRKEE